MMGLWSEHFAAASDNPTTSRVDVSQSKTNGDWSQHLPASDQPTPPSPRRLLCPKCNAAICRLQTSNTDKNSNRKFYSCPDRNHKFFKWADEVNPNQFIVVPNCGGCGAGACRVRRETNGSNAGRILFTCTIKEGEGACGYSVWQDELEKSETALRNERISSSQSTISCDDISATNIDLVVESNKVDEGADVVMTPIINTSELHKCRAIISPKMGHSNKPNKSSRRPHKRSRHGDLKASGSLVSTRSLKVRLSMNNVSVEYSWMDDAKRQNLTSQLNGWWGRLTFQPKPCLVTYASKLNTCYVSLPLDSTFVVQDPILVNNIGSTTRTRSRVGVKLKKCRNTLGEKIVVNSHGSTNVTQNLREAESYGLCRENTELFRAALDVPSLSKTKMSKSISNAFCEAAQHLQNNLLTLLETMEVKDHVAMREAAEATFAALDHLFFGHQDFKDRVNELIHCASSLSEIEQSMPMNDLYQKLVERSSERKRLDEINCVHAETINIVSNKKKCLKDLKEEITSTLDLLFQIEAEMSCFEIEMRAMEIQLEQISRDKEELEGKYLITFKEVEKSKELFERKEEERAAAKAAYDRAIALLRG